MTIGPPAAFATSYYWAEMNRTGLMNCVKVSESIRVQLKAEWQPGWSHGMRLANETTGWLSMERSLIPSGGETILKLKLQSEVP